MSGPVPSRPGFPGETAFALDTSRGLRLGPDVERGVTDFLAHLVARRPGDLLRHVQRINAHADRGEPERLFGALVDLFVVLGRRGLDLRRRLLETHRARLDGEQAHWLDECLSSGLSATSARDDIPGSMLVRPVKGSLDLVRRRSGARAARTPLEEARALLDEGRIDVAQDVLERALSETPGETALAEELLMVYRATRNGAGYVRFRRLLEDGGCLPEAWRNAGELAGEDGK